ncbi:MAG: 2-C-methyl-D-erythritol 2,4-cyclodiphosphate synthase [bacterium]|nr:2-C-methyl-D-erythritol 2,4-cyclodiphosphate synthase [bacterium]
MSEEIRVGHGFDTHRFSDDPDRPLILGGIRFEGTPGLVGHSDGDAVAHAVIDALLSAAGMGDIGVLFPDTDEAWAGADSIGLLADAVARLDDAGWRVVNADCTVVTEQPRIAPHREEMEARLSGAAGAPVAVKGKRAEALGALGRGEGLACWAVALIERQ